MAVSLALARSRTATRRALGAPDTGRRLRAALRRDMRTAANAAGATMATVLLVDALTLGQFTLATLATNLIGSVLVALSLVALRGPVRRQPNIVGGAIGVTGLFVVIEPILGAAELRPLMLAYFALLVVSMAVFMPWDERWHRGWVAIAFGSLVAVGLAVGGDAGGAVFLEHLVVIGVASSIASVVGHATLHRRRLRTYSTEQQLRALHRRRESDEQELRRLNTELLAVSRADPLTRVGNRLRFEEDMRLVMGRLATEDGAGVLGFLDVDHFKRYNDAVGHLAGDAVLKAIAESIGRVLRPGDGIYRFGGEEFLVLLPGVSRADGAKAIDRIRQAVADMQIPHPDNDDWPMVTVSAGAATIERTTDPDAWLRAADAALYAAKSGGRNRTELAA